MSHGISSSQPVRKRAIWGIGVIITGIIGMLVLAPRALMKGDGPNSSNSQEAAQPQASPTPNYGGIIFGHGYFQAIGFYKINPDGTNRLNLTDMPGGLGRVRNPSVSRQTGMIAFEAENLSGMNPSVDNPDQGTRIFVMNGDGSAVRQITFAPNPGGDANNTRDFNPSISPDGTKVAFISSRNRGTPVHTCGNAGSGTLTQQDEVWVVNTDGSGLARVTNPVYFDNTSPSCSSGYYCACFISENYRVAWSADSQHLVIAGSRPYTFSVDPRPSIVNAIVAWSDTGRFGTLYGVNDPANNVLADDDPNKQATLPIFGHRWLDVSSGNRVLFRSNPDGFNGTGPNGNSLGFWTPGTLGISRTLEQSVMGDGQINDARFSPDGAHYLIYGHNNGQPDGLFIDSGGNPVPGLDNGFIQSTYGLAWAPGPVMPTPTQLVLAPNPIVLYNQNSVQVTPTLLDAQGNAIVRAAMWQSSDQCPNCGLRCDNEPDQILCGGAGHSGAGFAGLMKWEDADSFGNLCAGNAGLRTCIPFYNSKTVPVLTNEATTPAASVLNLTPGVFTIRREVSSIGNLAVNFSVGGTAVRDVDYTLNVNGNSFVMTDGQTTTTINVQPTGSSTGHGDKTVILTLEQEPSNAFYVDGLKNAATVTIKDDAPPPTPTPTPTPTPSSSPSPSPTVSPSPSPSPSPSVSPSPSPSPSPTPPPLVLSAVTPNKGGDGGTVTATIYGANIKPGAIVKLSRSGFADIIGANTNVAVSGGFITATFDLTKQQQGAWDVVVTNPGNQTKILSAAFTIETNKGAQVWVDVIGREVIRTGREQSYYILYGNGGNIDAGGVPVIRGIPPNAVWKIDLPARPIVGGVAIDWDLLPLSFSTGKETVIPLPVAVIAPGQIKIVRLKLTLPDSSAHDAFELSAIWMEGP